MQRSFSQCDIRDRTDIDLIWVSDKGRNKPVYGNLHSLNRHCPAFRQGASRHLVRALRQGFVIKGHGKTRLRRIGKIRIGRPHIASTSAHRYIESVNAVDIHLDLIDTRLGQCPSAEIRDARIGTAFFRLFQRQQHRISQRRSTHPTDDSQSQTTKSLLFFPQIHGRDATFSLQYLQQSHHCSH